MSYQGGISISEITDIFDVISTISTPVNRVSNNDGCAPGICTNLPDFSTNPCSQFEFYICTVVVGMVCLMGLVLNTISIVVFSHDRHNLVPTFLFKSLACADIAVLLISLLVLSCMLGPSKIESVYYQLRFVIPFFKKYLNPVGYISQACTIWLTVALSVHRYVAICHPFVSRKVLTINRVRIQVAIIVLVSVIANVPRFFQYDIIWVLDSKNITIPKKDLTPLGSSPAFILFYGSIFYNVIILILPLLFLIFLNVFICHQLNTARKKMRWTISAADAAINSRQDKSINIVMILIVAQLLICHSPDRIVIALSILESKFHISTLCPDTILYCTHISNLLIIINSSTDFFIYYAFKPRFRLILARCCCRRGTRDRERSVSHRSPSINSQKRPSIFVEGFSRPAGRESVEGVKEFQKLLNNNVVSSEETEGFRLDDRDRIFVEISLVSSLDVNGERCDADVMEGQSGDDPNTSTRGITADNKANYEEKSNRNGQKLLNYEEKSNTDSQTRPNFEEDSNRDGQKRPNAAEKSNRVNSSESVSINNNGNTVTSATSLLSGS